MWNKLWCSYHKLEGTSKNTMKIFQFEESLNHFSLLSIAAIMTILSVLFYFDTFYVMENSLTRVLLKEPRKVHDHIKIMAIDEESLDQIGRWPWPRDVVANTIEQLADSGAKAVFADIAYDQKSRNPVEDATFQAVLNKHSNIYLPAYFQFKDRQEHPDRLDFTSVNYPIFQIHKKQIGHINTLEDKNAQVTKILMGVRDQSDMVPSIDVRLANELLPPEKKIRWNDANQWFIGNTRIPTDKRGEVIFAYASFPQDKTFDVIPMIDVIHGAVKPAYFKDSVVLIGAYSAVLQDLYYTPMSKNRRMFGVEIHANAIQSLLDGNLYQKTPNYIGHFILALLILVSFFLMQKGRLLWAAIYYFLLLTGYLLLVMVFFHTLHLILPSFYPLLAITMTYIATVIYHYTQERNERTRVTQLFGRYVSKGVVQKILSSQDEIKLGGIRMDVSILFVDIRGFTPLSEQVEPEIVIAILNEYLEHCTNAVFTQGGTLDKFTGDGLMAIFGAPFVQTDHADRAIQTALLIQAGAPSLSERLQERFGTTVEFGMGIHSGPAIIGNIGSRQRFDYTAIGDTVNAAARLESNAKPGQILISENTYHLSSGDYDVMDLETISVKGKSELIKIYEVRGIKSRTVSRPREGISI